jgi:glycosyltransferase involved in cell wall biosynthesis
MSPRILLWGTYDLGKPRTRIMRASLAAAASELTEIHADVWSGVEDKSQLSPGAWLARGARWLFAYPLLIWRYMRAGPHDVVVVPYMGHLDVLVLWPLARLRGVPIVWDAFLSLYDTVARDRGLIAPDAPPARMLAGWERLAANAASRVVLDTAVHAEMFRALHGLPPRKMAAVFVGAEDTFSLPRLQERSGEKDSPLRVLFYGQFAPLHGIETIIEAARLARDEPIEWRLIGKGQEAPRIRAILQGDTLPRLSWTEWVPYEKLRLEISRADICLGIFGKSEKAARVIPNKVFQIIAAGKPLVTRDSPAMHELVGPHTPGVRLVPPGDGAALLAGLKSLTDSAKLDPIVAQSFTPDRLAANWLQIVSDAIAEQQGARDQPRNAQ